jgi:hypothetical protein
LPPASIGQYDNDCVIVAMLVDASFENFAEWQGRTFPRYDNDEHGTNYNILHTVMKDSNAKRFGWPKHAFFFGPPVSVKCFTR